MIVNNVKSIKVEGYFNRFACFWPKGYLLGSLGKSHQNGDYLISLRVFIPHISGQDNYRSTLANLKPVTTYNVQLRANNSAGWGDYTEVAYTTTGENSNHVWKIII